jgi:predicted transcriptional regulator
MAMTLRLDDDQAAALRAQAAREGRSMHEIAVGAIEQYVRSQTKRALVDVVLDTELVRYADALDRLGR